MFGFRYFIGFIFFGTWVIYKRFFVFCKNNILIHTIIFVFGIEIYSGNGTVTAGKQGTGFYFFSVLGRISAPLLLVVLSKIKKTERNLVMVSGIQILSLQATSENG